MITLKSAITSRPFKYFLYCMGLLVACVYLPGVHDAAFFYVVAGVLIGNLVFSVWILPLPIYASVPIGLVLPNLAIAAAFGVIMMLVDGDPVALAITFCFFACLFTILLWEGVIALARSIRLRRNPD